MKEKREERRKRKHQVLIGISLMVSCFVLSGSVAYAASYFETDQDGHVVDLSETTEVATSEFLEESEEFLEESESLGEELEESTGESESVEDELEESIGESESMEEESSELSGGLSDVPVELESETLPDQYFYDQRSGGVYRLNDAGEWSYEPIAVSVDSDVSVASNTAVSIPSDGVIKYRIRFNGAEYTLMFAESDAQYLTIVDGLLYNVSPGDKITGRAFDGDTWNPTRPNSYYIELHSLLNLTTSNGMGNGNNVNAMYRYWWSGSRVSSEITYGDVEVIDTMQSSVDYKLCVLLGILLMLVVIFIFKRSGSND